MSGMLSVAEPVSALRLICGAFFIPHIFAKLQFPPPLLDFFEQAGLRPARLFMTMALVLEAIAATALIFNLFTPIAALLAAAVLTVATICLYRVRGPIWIWDRGGFEFPVFWILALIVVARLSST